MSSDFEHELLLVSLRWKCYVSYELWPSSWDHAELVAPQFRKLIPEDMWQRWDERRRREEEEERAAEASESRDDDSDGAHESDEDGSDGDETQSCYDISESDGDDSDMYSRP